MGRQTKAERVTRQMELGREVQKLLETCTCRAIEVNGKWIAELCPLHAAAPEMLVALRGLTYSAGGRLVPAESERGRKNLAAALAAIRTAGVPCG